jgi:hypothetical protein
MQKEFDPFEHGARPVEFDPFKHGARPVLKKGPDLYEYGRGTELVPLEEIERIWKLRGRDPAERLALTDKKQYRNDKTRVTGNAYVVHVPTWKDRGKEFLQGVGGGLANIPDIASNYVGAPVTFLGSQFAKGQGKLLNSIGLESGAKYSNKMGDNLQKLSDKYWNQNLSEEIKNSKILATKNRDTTAAMLRTAGEFATDILPASAVGTGAKYLARGVKVASPAVKGLKNRAVKWWKEPKLPKVAKLLETPLTAKNTAAFAGAGAGHGYINTDSWGDAKKPSKGALYELATDIPFVASGAAIGGGVYGGLKGLGKLGVNAIKGTKSSSNKMPAYYKSLAKKINKGNNELDEEFINAVKGTTIDLTPFNIYKNNEIPFKISKNNSEKEYLKILPKLKEGIHDETENLLNKRFVKYNKDSPFSDINYTSENFRKLLKDTDTVTKETARVKYEGVKTDALDKTKLSAKELLKEADNILKNNQNVFTSKIGGNNAVIGVANNIKKTLEKKPNVKKTSNKSEKENVDVRLRDLYIERENLNNYLSKEYARINPINENQKRQIKNLKDAIDKDIYIGYEKGIVPKDWYIKFVDANTYHTTNRGPFKNSKLFKKIRKNKKGEGEIVAAINNNNQYDDLKELLDLAKNNGLIKNKQGKVISTKEEDVKLTTDWLKRLELQKELFNGLGNKEYSVAHLKGKINGAKSHTPLYNYEYKNPKHNVGEELRSKISPIIKKYEDVLDKDRYYKGGLNGLNNPTYYGDMHGAIHKFMRPASLHYGGATLGATVGGLVGPIGAGLGGLVGAGVGHAVNGIRSARIMKAMTDKQFVNELIRLGRLPKEKKQSMMLELSKYPILKTEIIKSLFKKDDKKNN